MEKDNQDITYSRTTAKYLRLLTLVFFTVVLFATAIFLIFAFFGPLLIHDTKVIEHFSEDNPVRYFIESIFSCGLALMVVLVLRYSAGPIEFEGLSFKFKGASAPVVMWVMCYIVLMIGFRLY